MRTLISLTSLLLLSSCLPVMVGGAGAATVTAAAREKGLSGGMSDSTISTSIKSKLYSYDRDVHRRVGVNVQNGEVLLTGSLDSQDVINEVERLTWSVDGVKKVLNEMGVNTDDGIAVGEITTDSWVTTQIKSSLLFNGDIKSINYSIKTVSGIVHVMGIAQNQAELDKVLDIAKTTRGVKTVKSYVQIKENAGISDDDAPAQDVSTEDGVEVEAPKPSKKKGKVKAAPKAISATGE